MLGLKHLLFDYAQHKAQTRLLFISDNGAICLVNVVRSMREIGVMVCIVPTLDKQMLVILRLK